MKNNNDGSITIFPEFIVKGSLLSTWLKTEVQDGDIIQVIKTSKNAVVLFLKRSNAMYLVCGEDE